MGLYCSIVRTKVCTRQTPDVFDDSRTAPYEESNVIDLAYKLLTVLKKRRGFDATKNATFVMSQEHYNKVEFQLREYHEWFHTGDPASSPMIYGVEIVTGGYDMDVDVSLVVDFR